MRYRGRLGLRSVELDEEADNEEAVAQAEGRVDVPRRRLEVNKVALGVVPVERFADKCKAHCFTGGGLRFLTICLPRCAPIPVRSWIRGDSGTGRECRARQSRPV